MAEARGQERLSIDLSVPDRETRYICESFRGEKGKSIPAFGTLRRMELCGGMGTGEQLGTSARLPESVTDESLFNRDVTWPATKLVQGRVQVPSRQWSGKVSQATTAQRSLELKRNKASVPYDPSTYLVGG